MSIEKFFPEKASLPKRSFFEKALKLFRPKERETNFEFYSDDGTKRFSIYPFKDGSNVIQFNVTLYYKISEVSWAVAMAAMTRWTDEGKQIYGIEVEGLMDKVGLQTAMYWYDYSTGGRQRSAQMWGRPFLMPTEVEKTKAQIQELGFPLEKDLPEFIDFEATLEAFLSQAKNLDFSFPALTPKHLVK